MTKKVSIMVPGGKATAGPPVATILGPMGINVGQVVAQVNQKTKEFNGIKVKVILEIDTSKRQVVNMEVKPSVAAYIKKELGIQKGSGNPKEEKVGDLSLEKIIEIAKIKMPDMNAKDLKGAVLQVLGTCVSMGVTVNGEDPRVIQQKIKNGEIEVK